MRTRRALRIGFAGFGIVVALAAIFVGLFLWRFDPNAYKPRIEAAAQTALGREVSLRGPVRLAFSLRPTITVTDVTLANPPGFSSPEMARVKEIDLRLDLPALLGRRVVVQRLVVDTPQVALERNAAGDNNWTFAPVRQPAANAGPSSSVQPRDRAEPLPFLVEKVQVQHAAITYRDDRTRLTRSIDIPQVELSAASASAPLHFSATASSGADRFDLTGTTGPLAALLAGAGPWPITAKLHATGAVYDAKLDVSAPGADEPLSAALAGTLRSKPFSSSVQFGSAAALLSRGKNLPVSMRAEAAGASLQAQGSIADPAAFSGVNIALAAQSSDLSVFGEFLGTSLPPLRTLTFSARLADLGGLAKGAALQQLRIASEQGDLAGEVQVSYAGRLALRAALTGTRLDAVALRSTAAKPPASAPPPPPVASPPPPAGHMISDTPLPFSSLREADANLSLKLGAFRSGKLLLTNVDATAQLAQGALALKARATMDKGPVDLTATVNAQANPPGVAIALTAPALPVSTLLAALGSPEYANGTIAVAADLHGAGASPHAIAAGLNGKAVMTMQGGRIDTRLLEASLGPAIARANPLALLSRGEASDLRCLVANARIANGQATLAPLLLSSGLITVSGSGSANLATETLDLHLRPEGRAGGVAFSVPMTVTGSFRTPHVEVAQSSAANAGAAAVMGLLGGKNLGTALGGTLGDAGPSCAAAIAEAHGAPAPATPAHAAPAAPATPRVPDAGTLLRQFLR